MRRAATSPIYTIRRDRRVADVETVYDPQRGLFNQLFATASAAIRHGRRPQRISAAQAADCSRSLVKNIFSDFKRHDVGPNFYERNYDGSMRREFMTTPLWGVGHDRRRTGTTAAASI